jgi:GMP synthase-like glutamine amidotransferase
VTLPADSQVLGASRSCTNEIFLTGKNLLSFQGHPE